MKDADRQALILASLVAAYGEQNHTYKYEYEVTALASQVTLAKEESTCHKGNNYRRAAYHGNNSNHSPLRSQGVVVEDVGSRHKY